MRAPTVWHWNMTDANIFVEDGRISSLVDWWEVEAKPAFLQVKIPSLVRRIGDEMTQLPEGFEDKDDADQDFIKQRVKDSVLQRVYEHASQNMNPAAHRVLAHPHHRTLRWTVAQAHNNWDSDILPFRECLLKIERCAIFPKPCANVSQSTNASVEQELERHRQRHAVPNHLHRGRESHAHQGG